MNGPAGSGLAFTALLALLACPYAACRAFTALRKTSRRASPPPGAGAVKTPVPGKAPHPVAPAAAPGRTPPRPAPAPAPQHPQHGIRILSADFYEDGTVLVHDHLRRTTTKFEAPDPGPGTDWDGWAASLEEPS